MAGENEWDWSTTAATNSAADSSIGWPEGQDPATVNNSARSMMAARAKARNLQSGSITTGGSGNAQTVLSGLGFSTVPTGLCIRVKIGFTNTASTTLNVDGIGAVTIKDQSGNNLAGGELLLNSYCDLRYDGTNWVLLTPTRFPASTFSAGITATTGTFSGAVSMTALTATTGAFSSNVTVTGTLGSGAFSATTGTFSSTLAATGRITGSAGVTVGGTLTAATTGAFSGAVSMAALTATTGTFSGAIGATTGTFSSNIGVTGTVFAGALSASGDANVAGSASVSGTIFADTFSGANLAIAGNATVSATIFTDTFSGNALIIAGNGSVSGTMSANAFNTTSDERLKEDLQPIANPGAIIDSTEVHDFRWKKDGKRAYGVMAQHAVNALPYVVIRNEEADTWGVDYSRYVPILLAELKELRARVAALEAA